MLVGWEPLNTRGGAIKFFTKPAPHMGEWLLDPTFTTENSLTRIPGDYEDHGLRFAVLLGGDSVLFRCPCSWRS